MILDGVHRNIKLRLGVGFVRRFLDIMLAPLMVIHFARLYGPATAGLLTSVIAVVVIGCTFFGGHLSDVRGRRPTLLLGEIGSSAAFVLLALANSPWWHSGLGTYVFYLLSAALFGIAVPANDGMMVDVSTSETRSTIYTINYWSINVAFVCGSLVGGFAYGRYFSSLLLAAAVLSALIVIVTWVAVTETAPGSASPEPGRLRTILTSYASAMRDRVLIRIIVAALLVRSVEIQISYYIATRLAGRFPAQDLLGVPLDGVKMLGVLRAINTFLVVCLALFSARLFGRLSQRRRIYVGLTVFTAGYMVWGAGQNACLLIAAGVVLTIGELMAAPPRQVLMAELMPAGDRSRYMAVYQIHIRLGMVVGSLCVTLGVLVPPAGMSLLFGLFGLGAILLYRSLFRARDAQAAAPAEPVTSANGA